MGRVDTGRALLAGAVLAISVVMVHPAGAGEASARCATELIATDLRQEPYTLDPQVALSADGFTAAYRTPDGVVIEDLVSRERTPVPSNPGDIEFSPALSADGTRLAYLAGTQTDGSGHSRPRMEAYVFDTTSGEATKLTTEPGVNFQTTISADGSTVAYANSGAMVVHDLDAGSMHRGDIAIYDWVGTAVSISPDGSQVAFSTSPGDLYLHDVSAEETRPVGPRRSFLAPRFLADGTRLAIQSSDDLDGANPDRHLRPAIYDIGTGTITPAGPASTPAWSDPLISGDGTHHVAMLWGDPAGANPDGFDELFSTELSTGAVSQLTSTTPDDILHALAVSTDGSRVAYAQESRRSIQPDMSLSIATTCDPAPRADAQVATAVSRRFLGDDVYAVDATPAQRRSARIGGGGSRSFLVRLQNDRTTPDTLTVSGRNAGDAGFVVRYRYGGADVTEAVEAGTFSTGALASGASIALQVKITADDQYPPVGARHHVDVTARSDANPVAGDTVRARVVVGS